MALRVHAAAEDEAVRDPQPDEICADRLRTREALFDQHGALKTCRAESPQLLADGKHRVAAVEDVIEHEDRTISHAGRRRDPPFDSRSFGGVAVARDMQVIEIQWKAQER